MIPADYEPAEHRWICTGDECGDLFHAPGIVAICPACGSRAVMDTREADLESNDPRQGEKP